MKSCMVEKLIYLKKRDRMTTRELSRKSGIPIGTLNKILCGETKRPSLSSVERLAVAFDVAVRYLMDDDVPVECAESAVTALAEKYDFYAISERERLLVERFRCCTSREKEVVERLAGQLQQVRGMGEKAGSRRLPVYLAAAAGGQGVAIGAALVEEMLIQDDNISRQSDFVVQVMGDAMAPLYCKGDLLGVRQGEAKHNQIGAFLLNGEGFVRRYFHSKGVTKLISINRKVPIIQVKDGDDLCCMGVVVGIVRRASGEEMPMSVKKNRTLDHEPMER